MGMNHASSRPRAHLTPAVDIALRHLAIDLNRTVGDLLADGALVLLRMHDRAERLPAPTVPGLLPATTATAAPGPDHHVTGEGEAREPQEIHVLAHAGPLPRSSGLSTTLIDDLHVADAGEEEDDREDEDDADDMVPHPDELLAEAGFRVPRSSRR